jgi:hypothetical protein
MLVVIESDVSFLFLLYVIMHGFVPTDSMEWAIGGGIETKHDMAESGLLEA